MGIHGNEWDFFVSDFKKLSERVAKYTADVVNKYNNTVHRTIKIKLINVTSDFYAEYNEDSNEKILNL